MNSKLKAAIIIVLIASLFIGVVAAAGYLMTAPASNPGTVNPTPTPTPSPTPTPVPEATMSKVTLSVYTLTIGESWTLSTTVSDATPGVTVTFHDQTESPVGASVTNALGTASLTITPALGNWLYHAHATHP